MDNNIYPFKFLDSYQKDDVEIFFGRDEEIEQLYEMLSQTNIVMVYGASGTGKTSLIQCGLSKKLNDYDWLPFFIRRGANLNTSVLSVLENFSAGSDDSASDFLDQLLSAEDGIAGKPDNKVVKLLKNIYTDHFKPVYLIFDQFEELYILGTKAEQTEFIHLVKEILRHEPNVRLIFSIREEYLGHLYQFEKNVPQLLRKKLRVEAMHRDKVLHVISGITAYSKSLIRIEANEMEPFTDMVFEKIKAKNELTIQLPYLQVFLDKLYVTQTNDRNRQTPAKFTLAALQQTGDIGDVLSEFLEEQVQEIRLMLRPSFADISDKSVWSVLSPFATLEGTKEPLSIGDLSERLPNANKEMLRQTVEAFVQRRILRFSEKNEVFELAHDSLAKRIAEKRSDDEIALLEVRRLIKSQTGMKAEARETFSEKQLAFIEPFIAQLKLTETELAHIQQSRTQIETEKAAKRKRQQRLMAVIIAAAVVSLAFGIFGFVMWNTSQNTFNRLEEEKHKTDSAFTKAQKLIDAFYFYDDKFALAFGDKQGFGNEFYFIDKKGDVIEKLGYWEKAEQFDYDGWSKVLTSKKNRKL